MASILKTDEIQSQNGGAVVKMQTLKHPSSSGNNLVLGSDGSATIANGTLSAGTIGTSVTGFGLIRNAQEFRIQGEFDGSGGGAGRVLGSGTPSGNTWGENSSDYSRHGTSIWSQSSGVFTCSVTGIFSCSWMFSVSDATGGDMYDPTIQIDTGSGYNNRAQAWGHVSSTTNSMSVGNTFMFKVADTSNFNLRYIESYSNSIASTTHIQGSPYISWTNIVFVRLGDV